MQNIYTISILKNSIMLIILDNGHGVNTPGKRSPVWDDNTQLLEYEFNRDIVKRIKNKLDQLNIPSVILVPELEDISLVERCRRVNNIYFDYKDCLLLSIHANAGGGTGWEAYTSIGVTKSDNYSTIFYNIAREYFAGWNIRVDFTDKDPDKESNFFILKNTLCPAILTENFFMDTQKDCRYILSEEGRENIANMHVAAIQKIVAK